MEEMEELDRLFPPLQVTSRNVAEQAVAPPGAANNRASSLRRGLEALSLDDNSGGEENPDPLSPPPYRQVSFKTTTQSQITYQEAYYQSR
jgi:hypothetical protein